ncbi:Gfo/Idh/MocA family protein [Herbidospora mongoliensis]|uniref:Gfo/Idh/MocA family protein n=1 Tax=Herbidospora mongoliensis TaxID=688067 RepID=UPI00082A7BC1|nr:Gfo/Idh/MocA family oxidoreductase [Herbidospora mongoliensis]
MKIAMIGLGSIARKAYLPVLSAIDGAELVFCTRDPATLLELGDAYRVPRRHTSVAETIAGGVDAAFVHTATDAHPAIVTELLEAGVPVFVDKPLAYRLDDAERLVELARERGVPLMVGFNRRYAPGIVRLKDLPRDLVILQKNRHTQPEDPRRMVFDDFIHVADTLRFLAPGEVTDVSVRIRLQGSLLEHVVLELSGDGFTALGMMSRVSGQTEETCEVIGRGEKHKVLDLGAEIAFTEAGELSGRRPDWVSVGTQRGFSGACLAFLTAVGEGRLLDAGDALETHRLCERILDEVDR